MNNLKNRNNKKEAYWSTGTYKAYKVENTQTLMFITCESQSTHDAKPG